MSCSQSECRFESLDHLLAALDRNAAIFEVYALLAKAMLASASKVKLENLLHCIFERARHEIEIKDRFGHPVVPREWFLVPLHAIDEAVERIKDGSIKELIYDQTTASLVTNHPTSTS